MKIKNRHRLKARDIKHFQEELKKTFTNDFFNERLSVETGDFDDQKIVFVDSEPCFMFYDNKIILPQVT